MSSNKTTPQHTALNRRSFLAAAVLLILIGFTLRSLALLDMPMYLDEAMHTWWGQQIITEHTYFIGLEHAKALFPLVLALFQPSGPESPYLARMISVFAGTASIAASIALGRQLADRRTGLLAGLIYAVLPLALFHERQALVDPLMATLTLFSVVFAVQMARRPRWWLGLLLGVTLGAAYLAKINALPFFALPFAAAVLFGHNRKDVLKALGYSAAAALIGFVIVRGFYALAAASGFELLLNDPTESRLRLLHLADPQVRADLARDWENFTDFVWRYVGPVLVALIPVSFVGLFQKRRQRAVLFLLIPVVGFTAAWLMVRTESYTLPARYFVWAAGPLAALAALSLTLLAEAARQRRTRLGALISTGLLLAFLLPGLRFDALLIGAADRAPIARGDEYLYFRGLTSGSAYQRAAQDLLRQAAAEGRPRPISVLSYKNYFWQLSAQLGPRVGHHGYLNPNNPYQYQDLARMLANDEDVYFMESAFHGRIPDWEEARVEQFGSYDYYETQLTLYRVTGAEGQLAAEIYNWRVPPPETFAPSYDQLAADLLAAGPHGTLIFPAGHADALTARGLPSVTPIQPAQWPLTPGVAAETLDSLDLGTGGETIDVVQANPTRLDAQHAIADALHARLYTIGEQWYDLVNRTTYVTGPLDPDFQPAQIVWEDAIHLDDVALVDGAPAPGQPVRIALRWHTDVPVQDSFSIFAHLVDGSGALVAQYDGIPGGGLRPMPGWEPGQPVEDRFAIMLPPDVPPGELSLQIGIYNPANGLRLRVTGGTDTVTDHANIAQIVVTPGEDGP